MLLPLGTARQENEYPHSIPAAAPLDTARPASRYAWPAMSIRGTEVHHGKDHTGEDDPEAEGVGAVGKRDNPVAEGLVSYRSCLRSPRRESSA